METANSIQGIMPQIAPMLRGLGVPLPFLTRFMISVSDIFAKQGLYIVFLFAIICIVLVILYRRSTSFRKSTQYILIKVPLVGNFLRNHSLIGFLRSMGSLIVSGASSTRAFSSVSLTISILPIRNRYIQNHKYMGIFYYWW
jgi:type IV pilus assembly protein PilC